MVVHRYYIGRTTVSHRYQYGTLLRPPESRQSIAGHYQCSTDINKAIPEYCHCSSIARSSSASAEIFKHVQKFLPSPAIANFVDDVLPMYYRSYRCDTVARLYQYRSPKIDKFVLRYCSGEPNRLGVTALLE